MDLNAKNLLILCIADPKVILVHKTGEGNQPETVGQSAIMIGGKVENFPPMPVKGHVMESCEINGVCFGYSDPIIIFYAIPETLNQINKTHIKSVGQTFLFTRPRFMFVHL